MICLKNKEIEKLLSCDNCKLKECIQCEISWIERKIIREYIEQLETKNTKLKQIQELGLNREKQYCFNEDGHTGKCLGYSSFNNDEPCNYCKSCERLSIKEDD